MSKKVNAQAEKYKAIGNDEFKNGNFSKAIENYTYAIEMDPTHTPYVLNRATAYFKMNDLNKALRDANKAISIDPSWDKAYWRRGTILSAQKSYSEALENFQKAYSLSPGNTVYLKDLEETRKHLPRGELLKKEGNELFKDGKFSVAAAKYEEALSYFDDKPEIKADLYSNLAACYSQQEIHDMKKVIELTTSALELVPGHPKALLRRGQAYEALEKYKLALEDFEQVARIYPDNKTAREAVNRVRLALKNF